MSFCYLYGSRVSFSLTLVSAFIGSMVSFNMAQVSLPGDPWFLSLDISFPGFKFSFSSALGCPFPKASLFLFIVSVFFPFPGLQCFLFLGFRASFSQSEGSLVLPNIFHFLGSKILLSRYSRVSFRCSPPLAPCPHSTRQPWPSSINPFIMHLFFQGS